MLLARSRGRPSLRARSHRRARRRRFRGQLRKPSAAGLSDRVPRGSRCRSSCRRASRRPAASRPVYPERVQRRRRAAPGGHRLLRRLRPTQLVGERTATASGPNVRTRRGCSGRGQVVGRRSRAGRVGIDDRRRSRSPSMRRASVRIVGHWSASQPAPGPIRRPRARSFGGCKRVVRSAGANREQVVGRRPSRKYPAPPAFANTHGKQPVGRGDSVVWLPSDLAAGSHPVRALEADRHLPPRRGRRCGIEGSKKNRSAQPSPLSRHPSAGTHVRAAARRVDSRSSSRMPSIGLPRCLGDLSGQKSSDVALL